MDLIETYNTHLILLVFLLSSLVLWKIYPKATVYKWIIAIVIIALTGKMFNSEQLTSDIIIHLSIDLMLVSGIALFIQQIESKFFKFIGLITTIALFPYFHHKSENLYTQNIPTLETDLLVDGELIIEVSNNHILATIEQEYHQSIVSIRPAFKVDKPNRTDLDDYYLIDLKSEDQAEQVIMELSDIKGVVWVEKNQKITLPDDSYRLVSTSKNNQLNDPLSKDQWVNTVFDIPLIHNKIEKNSGSHDYSPLIVILDTGVDAEHEDLIGNFYSLNSESNEDIVGHGTHCAGIAAAVSNNQIGISSLYPSKGLIRISSQKVLNRFGFGYQSTIIQGMIDAIDAGADVISLSLGTFTSEEREKTYAEAVRYANEHNVIVVVSAGNSSNTAGNYSPANTPGVISVGAIDQNMRLAPFTNTVEDVEMGIYAPGVNILSTIPDDKYGLKSGTSMAAPYIAGLAGLAKLFDRNINTIDFYHTLLGDQKYSTSKIVSPESVVEKLISRQNSQVTQ